MNGVIWPKNTQNTPKTDPNLIKSNQYGLTLFDSEPIIPLSDVITIKFDEAKV